MPDILIRGMEMPKTCSQCPWSWFWVLSPILFWLLLVGIIAFVLLWF